MKTRKNLGFLAPRKLRFSTEAQMEILGLAIVVVLILVATTFVVRFLVLRTPVDYRKGFVSSELASNMLNTFLKTAAKDCSQLTMTELLQDCVRSRKRDNMRKWARLMQVY